MLDLLRTALSFCVTLGVLVFVHELGHYLAARWRGVHVEVFSIGFGPPLKRWRDRSGTEWRIGPIPVGGYVKPHGFEGPEDASFEQQALWQPGRTFHDKPVGSRAIVILAGPVFNFVLAIALFTGLFMAVGRPHVGGEIGSVVADSPAAHAGLRAGDEITRVGTEPVSGYAEIQAATSVRPGQSVVIEVHRDGRELHLPLTIGTVASPNGGRPTGQIGVLFQATPGHPMSLPRAFLGACDETWEVSVKTLQGVGQMILGERSTRELGGTLRIAQMSGQVSHYGLASIVSFMALLSINLGLINLFPIPILDGGRLVFYAIEALRGRPVSRRVQELSFRAGFALIAGLFIFSTVNDLANFGLFRWLSQHG